MFQRYRRRIARLSSLMVSPRFLQRRARHYYSSFSQRAHYSYSTQHFNNSNGNGHGHADRNDWRPGQSRQEGHGALPWVAPALLGSAFVGAREEKENTAPPLLEGATTQTPEPETPKKASGPEQWNVRNLAFMGGGAKGIAYIGALLELKEQLTERQWQQIERCAGASAGAITAALLAVGYKPEKLEKMFMELSFREFFLDESNKSLHQDIASFMQDMSKGTLYNALKEKLGDALNPSKENVFDWITPKFIRQIKAIKELGKDVADLVDRISTVYDKQEGLCSGEKFYEWIQERMARKVAKLETGSEENWEQARFKYFTFGDLRKCIKRQQKTGEFKGHRHLRVVTAIKKGNGFERYEWSSENKLHDDVIIADAVRLSMSIPYVFQPWQIARRNKNDEREIDLRYRGVDGGTQENYPLKAFDFYRYAHSDLQGSPNKKHAPDMDFINPDTLGLGLYNGGESLGLLLPISAPREQTPQSPDLNIHRARDIAIDAKGITLYHIDVPEDKKKEAIASGRKAVKDYLCSHDRKAIVGYRQQCCDIIEQEKRKKREEIREKNKGLGSYAYASNLFVVPNVIVPDIMHLKQQWANEERPPIVVITGHSGSGKSTLSRYLADVYIDAFIESEWHKEKILKSNAPLVAIMDANTLESLRSSYEKLAETFQADVKMLYQGLRAVPNEQPGQTTKRQIKLLKKFIADKRQDDRNQAKQHWLFIYDTKASPTSLKQEGGQPALSADELKKYILQPTYTGHIRYGLIVIAQNDPYAERLDVKRYDLSYGLDSVKSRELLSKHCPSAKGDPDRLIKMFGGRPYSLVRIAERIKKNPNLTYGDLLDLLKKELGPILDQLKQSADFSALTDKELQPYALLKLELDNLQMSPHGQQLLELLRVSACLYEKDVPKALLKKYAKERYPQISQKDLAEIEKRLEELNEAHQLLENVQPESFSLHQITQKVIRNFYPPSQEEALALLKASHLYFEEITEKDKRLYHLAAFMLMHWENMINYIQERWPLEKLEKGSELGQQLAIMNNNMGLIYQQKLEKDSELGQQLAIMNNNMGLIYQLYGKHSLALKYFLNALELRKKVLSDEHLDTMKSHNNVAATYRKMWELDKALEHYGIALDICKNNSMNNDNNRTITSLYINLGNAHLDNGEMGKALAYYDEALKIQENSQNEELIAYCYNNIGYAHLKKGKLDEALGYLLKALDIREKKLGKTHTDLVETHSNIGAAYVLRDPVKALEHLSTAFDIQQKNKLGNDNANTAEIYNNMGLVYIQKNEPDNALEYFLKSLAIRQYKLGEEHPLTAESYNNIGIVYRIKGALKEARSHYKKALAIRQKKLGKNHPDTAESYYGIGLVYEQKGDLKKAFDNFEKCYNRRKGHPDFGPKHPITLEAQAKMSECQKKLSATTQQVPNISSIINVHGAFSNEKGARVDSKKDNQKEEDTSETNKIQLQK